MAPPILLPFPARFTARIRYLLESRRNPGILPQMAPSPPLIHAADRDPGGRGSRYTYVFTSLTLYIHLYRSRALQTLVFTSIRLYGGAIDANDPDSEYTDPFAFKYVTLYIFTAVLLLRTHTPYFGRRGIPPRRQFCFYRPNQNIRHAQIVKLGRALQPGMQPQG